MDTISFEQFKGADLRVAEIIEAREHPDADRLYLLKVKVGEEEKQLVAGIRASYEKDELAGKKIIIINNLEPAVIRGEQSSGMVLAASGEDGPVLLMPEKEVPSGSQIR